MFCSLFKLYDEFSAQYEKWVVASRHVDEANIYTERTARRVLRFALYRLREAHKDIIYFLTGREPAPSPDEPSISAKNNGTR